jgi:hypothetical protein
MPAAPTEIARLPAHAAGLPALTDKLDELRQGRRAPGARARSFGGTSLDVKARFTGIPVPLR